MLRGNVVGLRELLLVEDNPGDVLLVEEALEQLALPCRLSVARDGAVALEMLQGGARPELILLDVNLPKRSGFDVLKELKQDAELRHIPVIVLTSSKADRDVRLAYDLHANAYVCKPSDFDGYVSLVRRIADFWLSDALLAGK